jgi:carnitine O-acetyltransferase
MIPFHQPQAIQEAGKKFTDFTTSNDHASVVLKGLGKKFITSHRLSPDSFVQMSFQLAYWRRHQKTVSTYESCNTKHFLRGRTECIRSVTPQSVAFASTFDDPATDDAARFQRLKAAIEAHNAVASYCKEGRGVDRHLYGLLNIAKKHEMKLPAFFQDPTYATMGSSILSTSGLYSPYTALFGFGAVHQDGYGLGYMITSDSITVSVSNFNKDASQFAAVLSQSIKDLAELAQRVQGPK